MTLAKALDADQRADALEHLAAGLLNDGRDRRRAGVAAGAAVDVDDDPHVRARRSRCARLIGTGSTLPR